MVAQTYILSEPYNSTRKEKKSFSISNQNDQTNSVTTTVKPNGTSPKMDISHHQPRNTKRHIMENSQNLTPSTAYQHNLLTSN